MSSDNVQLYQIITKWKTHNFISIDDSVVSYITDDKIVVAQAFEQHKDRKEWVIVYMYPQRTPITQTDIVLQ